MRPVSIRPQVEALTSSELDWPTCESQSASPSLSRISLSAVAWSGMRSRASATHISSTPSSEDRSYSRMKASTMAGSAARTRVRSTRPTAVGLHGGLLGLGQARLRQQFGEVLAFVAQGRRR